MIYVLVQYPTETLGQIKPVLEKLKLEYKSIDLFNHQPVPQIDENMSGLIVLGGPMGAGEGAKFSFLDDEVHLLERVLAKELPVLGICLGAQLMARALGARVYPNRIREVGWLPIKKTIPADQLSLLADFPNMVNVLHWHGDTFDLPIKSTHLFKSDGCINQGFMYGKNALGLQFHLEANLELISSWLKDAEGDKFVRESGESSDAIFNQTFKWAPKLIPIAEAFFEKYFTHAYAKSS